VVTVRSIDGCYCLGTYFSLGDRYIVFATRAAGAAHDMDDMGACATELFANAVRGDIERPAGTVNRPGRQAGPTWPNIAAG
jgi:hypothetical protein